MPMLVDEDVVRRGRGEGVSGFIDDVIRGEGLISEPKLPPRLIPKEPAAVLPPVTAPAGVPMLCVEENEAKPPTEDADPGEDMDMCCDCCCCC